MTVSIPTSYDTTDINSEGGVLFGIPVQSTGLTTLCNNHNFAAANYCPFVGNYMNLDDSGDGIKGSGTVLTTGSNFNNLVAIPVARQKDGRSLICQFKASNTDSTNDATIRLKCGSVTSSTVTIPANTQNGSFTATVTSVPNSTSFVACLQVSNSASDRDERVKVSNAIWKWGPLSGSITDTPTASGFVWSQTGDHANTEPLTVEQFNRYRGGPRTIFEAMPQTASSFVDSLFQFDQVTATTRTLVGHLPILKRRDKLTVRFDCLAKGQTLEIFVPGKTSADSGTFYSVTPGISQSTNTATTDPATFSIASSSNISFEGYPPITVCQVYIKSASVSQTAGVFAIQGVVV